MGITAFPVLARILAERKLINTRVGRFAISCAAADDLSAWCVLAVITVIARPGAQEIGLPVRFAALVAYVPVMVFVIRPVARRLFPPNELPALGRFSAVMILLLASVWTTEALGVHALFGAFLAGLVMPKGGLLEAGLKSASNR
jgi:Kef-type K+ transport system membrane component KefB